MVHSICRDCRGEELAHLQRLWDILFSSSMALEPKLQRLFSHESTELDMGVGFFSSIDREAETQRFGVVHGSDGNVRQGMTAPLSTSYCRKTIEAPRGVLAVSDAPTEGWSDDPAYEKFGFRSYLGTTVTVEDDLYGTLCFASTDPREPPLTDGEKTVVKMFGQWVSYELDRWEGPSIDGGACGLSGEPRLSAERIDSMMDAVRKGPRRTVLLSLLDTHRSSIERLEQKMDDERARLSLHHLYLPKLAQEGYIEWTPGSRTVSRGSNFSEVEPLVRLLAGYTDG